MNDPALIVFRIFQFTFVPVMLTTPLIVVLCMLAWRTETLGREAIQRKIASLTVMTLLCIVGWLAFLVTAFLMRSPILQVLSTMAWLPFFPLWFLGAMPIAKLLSQESTPANSTTLEKRSASLANRQRKNPIRPWHWGLTFGLCGALLLASFLVGAEADRKLLTPQNQFLATWGMVGYVGLLILTYVIVQLAINGALREPEPLDSQGNPELERLYDQSRSSRILGLFWLLGFLQPVFLGLCLLLWTLLDSQYLIAFLGATGGTLFGLAGSWMGVTATLQRLKIAKYKMELDAQANKPVATN